MATKTLDKDQILEAIDTMTVLELSELVKAFEERYGVTAAAPVAAAAVDHALAVQRNHATDDVRVVGVRHELNLPGAGEQSEVSPATS